MLSLFLTASVAYSQLPNPAFFGRSFLPSAFSFTNQTGVALNTVATSNSVTLTGSGMHAVTAACSGCTLERNGSGTWAASAGGFKKGDTIRIRLTSSGSNGTAVTASVTVGAVISSVWSVTTVAYTYSWYQSGWSACPLNNWAYSGAGSCSASCGGGTQWQYYSCPASYNTQTQTVYCQRSDSASVADSFCSGAGTKPSASQSCYQSSCSGGDPSYTQSCNTQSCCTWGYHYTCNGSWGCCTSGYGTCITNCDGVYLCDYGSKQCSSCGPYVYDCH